MVPDLAISPLRKMRNSCYARARARARANVDNKIFVSRGELVGSNISVL